MAAIAFAVPKPSYDPYSDNEDDIVTPSNDDVTNPKYLDLDAEMILFSSDNRQFRVHLYVLKATSSFFNQVSEPGEHKYDIDAPTKVLRLVLDAIHNRYLSAELIWTHKDKFFSICDEYKFHVGIERALLALVDTIDKDPWEIFCLASKRGNHGLAKAALRALAFKEKVEGKGKPQIHTLLPQLADKLTMPYLLGLFQAALKWNAHVAKCKGDEKHEMDWQFIATHFEPVAIKSAT